MPVTLNANRQSPVYAHVEIGFADLASGVAAKAMQLPANALVIGGFINVKTVFNSATSDVLSLGDAASANRYANALNIHASTGVQALTPTGLQTSQNPSTNTTELLVTWTGVGAAPTTGALQLVVGYIVVGRSEFSTG